jgi:flavin reductase (DIM6/NTAB) family NADH-FMN oxidoreductase RutF
MAELFQRIGTGVYVVGVADGEKRNAFTAAWVMPVSFQPLLLALSINPRHSSYALLRAGRGFTLNVLARDQFDLAAHFGGPAGADKLAAFPWRLGRTGAPLLENMPAWFECEWAAECVAGDHVLVLGRVIDGALTDPSREPLSYRDTGDLDGAAALYPDAFG